MTRASSEGRGADFEGRGAPSPAEASAREVRAYFERVRSLVESKLDELVPAEGVEPASVHAAIRWSLFAPAKRLRPALVFAAGETFGARAESLIMTACAFELIHTYSLVHDDLPAMDDDELRRGRPTCHVRFGEATAILAGDALQALAFQTVAEDETLDAALRVRLISELARAAGTPEGMVAGQASDLEAEAREGVGGEELELIHRRKTGALIAAAARAEDHLPPLLRLGSRTPSRTKGLRRGLCRSLPGRGGVPAAARLRPPRPR